MVNLELYRVFYTVAKCGSLTRAADELFISQPAVSQAIKQLEGQLGTPLFNRTHRGMELSEQGGKRPVVIIQNDVGNNHSGTTIVAPCTGALKKLSQPTHVLMKATDSFLICDCVIELEQIRTVSKNRLYRLLGKLGRKDMERVDKAIKISLGL